PSLTLYFCNDPAPADLHTLSLHDALPILAAGDNGAMPIGEAMRTDLPAVPPSTSEAEAAELMRTHYTRHLLVEEKGQVVGIISIDRKSTRLNSSHRTISYAVFCLKKKIRV